MQIRRISLRAPVTAPKIRRRPALPTRTHFEHWTKPEHTRGPSLTRLLSRGRHLSYQRSRHTTHAKTSLIKIEGVDSTESAKYVLPDRYTSLGE